MLSWRLWRSLNQPPSRHPLRRFVHVDSPARKNRDFLLLIVVAFLVTPALCAWCSIIELAQHSAVIVAALPFGVSILFNGALLRWTLGISTMVDRLRTRGLLDMLAVIPLGSAGSGWLLSQTWLQHAHRFKRAKRNLRLLTVISGLVLILIVLVIFDSDHRMAEPYRSAVLTNDLAFAIDAFGLLVLLCLDYAQTGVFAAVAGIVDTVSELHHVDARLASITVFIVIESLLYLVMLLVTLVALPNLYEALGINAIVAALFTVAAQFALLIGGRELVIRALWQRLTHGDDLLSAEMTT